MTRLTIVVVFIIGLTAAKTNAAETNIEWRQIPEGKSKIVFFAPGLEGGNRRFYRGQMNRIHTVTRGEWAGPSGRFPNAEILFFELAPNYRLRAGRYVLKYFAEFLEFRRGRKVTYGEEMSSRNAVGRVIYGRLSGESVDCVQFAQLWREFGNRQRVIVGSYCIDARDNLSDSTIQAVIEGIGIRDVGVPATSGARPEKTPANAKLRKLLSKSERGDTTAQLATYRAMSGDEALVWLCRSAHGGSAEAKSIFGMHFQTGTSLPRQDHVEAYKWYSLAVSDGDQNAQGHRERLAKNMTPAQVAEAERLAAGWESDASKCGVSTTKGMVAPAEKVSGAAQPLCNDVGGYEAYMAKSGQVCELDGELTTFGGSVRP